MGREKVKQDKEVDITKRNSISSVKLPSQMKHHPNDTNTAEARNKCILKA